MSLKGLASFLALNYDALFPDWTLAFVKAEPWVNEGGQELGVKVTTQILDDHAKYSKPDTNNFGEQLVVKVREVSPSAFAQLKPLRTIVEITDVEKAVLYGDYKNLLSIIANIAVVKE